MVLQPRGARCQSQEVPVCHIAALESCLTLLRNPVVIVSAKRRRPCLNLSLVDWMM